MSSNELYYASLAEQPQTGRYAERLAAVAAPTTVWILSVAYLAEEVGSQKAHPSVFVRRAYGAKPSTAILSHNLKDVVTSREDILGIWNGREVVVDGECFSLVEKEVKQ